MAGNKSEYRNSPDLIKWVETISKNKNSNDPNKLSAVWFLNFEFILNIKKFLFRICFVFRISYLEIPVYPG